MLSGIGLLAEMPLDEKACLFTFNRFFFLVSDCFPFRAARIPEVIEQQQRRAIRWRGFLIDELSVEVREFIQVSRS